MEELVFDFFIWIILLNQQQSHDASEISLWFNVLRDTHDISIADKKNK